jgi:lipopolysaccharide export system protein LptA
MQKCWIECTINAFSNFRAFMKSSLIIPFMIAIGLGQPASAEKADRNKPMNIEADNMHNDNAQQLTVFTGKVLLTKGSIVMRATRLEVRQDAAGRQVGHATGTAKERAFFRQKRDGADEFIEGEAENLVYDGKADTLRLETNAVMRRYRGGVLADEVAGALIYYDNATEKFSVDGSLAGSGTGGRVRAVITPKPDSGDAASNAPARNATPATSK